MCVRDLIELTLWFRDESVLNRELRLTVVIMYVDGSNTTYESARPCMTVSAKGLRRRASCPENWVRY